MKGLFVNSRHAQCSIHESGVMVCNVLRKKYDLDYLEPVPVIENIPDGYDFTIFNWHFITMPLDTQRLHALKGLKIALVLEALPGNPFVTSIPTNFDEYMVLDPTMKHSDPRINAFPRPLENLDVRPYKDSGIPVIGSFGFATPGKGFELLVEQVNKEFDQAVVRLNIPVGTYCTGSSEALALQCLSKAKNGIVVSTSHEYFGRSELINWCSTNTINCFFYQRQLPGLSATTDQAIISGRPLLVSECETFRHIHKYTSPFPKATIRDAITDSVSGVRAMQKDWSPDNFIRTFAEMIEKRGLR